jgi:hypothetical protein
VNGKINYIKRIKIMKIKKVLLAGFISGLIMGIALFLSGAIASRIVYGPEMVPEGKFEPDQINAYCG